MNAGGTLALLVMLAAFGILALVLIGTALSLLGQLRALVPG